MPQLRFHIYTFVGSWPWCLGLAYAGYKLGESWDDPHSSFHESFHRFHNAVIVVLLIGVIWFVWSHVRRVRHANAA